VYEDNDEGIDEFMEEISDDLNYKKSDRNTRRMKVSLDSKRRRRRRIFWGAVIILLLVGVAIFFSGRGDKRFAGDLAAINTRINRLEKQLAKVDLNNTKKTTARLENQIRALKKSLARQNQKIAAMAKAEPIVEKKPKPKAGRKYHKVRTGETIYGIAQKYNISVGKLRSYNNLAKKQVISPGQKLWVAPANQ